MKIILYMAMSLDGFIAKKDGDSDWVSDVEEKIFDEKIEEMGCIVLGRTTYDQYKGELYPVEGVTNIVLTKRNLEGEAENVFGVNSVEKAIELAESKGFSKILLIGGGTINAEFINTSTINEMYISLYPIILGEGIKLFENSKIEKDLELISSKEIGEGIVQLYYSVK